MSKKKKNTAADANKNNTANKDSNSDGSYFARGRKKRKQYLKIIVPVVIGVVALATVLATLFPGDNVSARYGELGSAHEHAALLIILNGTDVDLAQQKYMVRSNYIHVESYNGTLDGTTLHKHASNVPLGEFLKSIRMDISNGCFITDSNQRFCENGEYKLTSYVNGNETKDIMNYVINDDDRILITYNNQNSTELDREFEKLNNLPINKI
ncbi:hypothetical protein [Candidatus Nitrosocosmicus franklandus]|uniref:Protein-disulfide isomerase n=1 Tax=Candidatus Nitrosocosmicus franklandianus TaxID=1798806 RepID=A0A484IBN4_9ARCH|nr:hypothetical protein [Candidatus Nitrosocosmicus franklandus]VFJ14195.1 conserved protein of unknown function [Candidatus Nitrosocosmicus franklandus]